MANSQVLKHPITACSVKGRLYRQKRRNAEHESLNRKKGVVEDKVSDLLSCHCNFLGELSSTDFVTNIIRSLLP